jgi:hypothetical protein
MQHELEDEKGKMMMSWYFCFSFLYTTSIEKKDTNPPIGVG